MVSGLSKPEKKKKAFPDKHILDQEQQQQPQLNKGRRLSRDTKPVFYQVSSQHFKRHEREEGRELWASVLLHVCKQGHQDTTQGTEPEHGTP